MDPVLAIAILASIAFLAAAVWFLADKKIAPALLAVGLFLMIFGIRILPLAGIVPPLR